MILEIADAPGAQDGPTPSDADRVSAPKDTMRDAAKSVPMSPVSELAAAAPDGEKTPPPRSPEPRAKPGAAQDDPRNTKPRLHVPATRRARWKRRGMGKERRRIYGLAASCAAAVFAGAVVIAVLIQSTQEETGADGPFARAVAEAFPEAKARRINVSFREIDGYGAVPAAATLAVPAYLLGSPNAESDVFARLGREFGIEQGMLSGPELGVRIEKIAAASLPPDLVRCQTYEIGDGPGERAAAGEAVALRTLHIHLNPGC